MPLPNPSRHFCPSLPLDPYLHTAVHRIKLLRLTLPDPVAAAAKPRPRSPPITFPWRGGARSSSARSCPPRPASAAPPSAVVGEARGEKMALYLLFQAASGYALFHAYGIDEIGQSVDAVRSSVLDLKRFSKAVKLAGFTPFSSAKDALDQQNAKVKEGRRPSILSSPGIMTDELRSFLELNLPKVKEGKKAKFSVGVTEPKVGSHITEATGIPCQSNEYVQERLHFAKFIEQLKCISPPLPLDPLVYDKAAAVSARLRQGRRRTSEGIKKLRDNATAGQQLLALLQGRKATVHVPEQHLR